MIAILGATGYVGRSLARKMARDGNEPLSLFARSPESLGTESWPPNVSHCPLSDFHASKFDLVINAIGAGDPKRVASMGAQIFEVTELWDRQVIATAGPHTQYVFLSSGAVYGTSFEYAATDDSALCLPVNHLDTVPSYILSKLCAESRHRCTSDRQILDLRIFGYADASIPRTGSFFLAELAQAVASRRPFVTSPTDMARDYAGVVELHALIQCWRNSARPNCALDLYTKAPVSKQAILEVAAARYGLEIVYSERKDGNTTAAKLVYASTFRRAAEFGYAPQRTSLDVVMDVLDTVAGP